MEQSSTSILIVAYGNLSRRDDGVAFHVVRRLRQRLGLPDAASAPGEAVDDDYAEWGDRLAVVCLHQLAPEIADIVAQSDIVVFVDAHVSMPGWSPVRWSQLAAEYHSGMVSHHLKPDAVLALCQSLYGRCTQGYVLSIEGSDFDFGETLSSTTSALLDDALTHLLTLLRAEGVTER
ncbi:MAG: hydrogenase maturation protease [Chloroflexi bacterium]|nr:hydrogenase maturation protease [Chloroflexota bacterium]